MKREDISDALGLVDESMISHALMVRRKKKKLRLKRTEPLPAKAGRFNMLLKQPKVVHATR
ncbi:hypothetical protein AALB53_25410, partial [Lachnospiraceae bacterium 47-T17]